MSTEEGAVVTSRPKKVRGGHKANMKKIFKDIDDNLRDFVMGREPQLLALRKSLEQKAETISKLDAEILDEIDGEEEIGEEIQATDAVQLEIQTKMLEIDVFLKKVNENERKPVVTSPAGPVRSKMRLPKLEIAKFGGNPREYRTFEDAFRVAIDENSCLSDIEKFTYLKSYLTGEAEAAVKGLDATEANYKEAREILKQRYGNKQVIVNSHMEALIKLPQVAGMNNSKNLRKVYDEIETNLRSLKSLGVSPNSFGCLLVPILLAKLPKALNLHLSRKFDSNESVWEIDEIMKELKKELEARERCQFEAEKNEVSLSKGNHTTVETLVAGDQGPSCAYCNGKHFSDQCRTVTNVAKRREILRTKRRCFRCTRENHISSNCNVKRSCFRCKGEHHTSICEKDQTRDAADRRDDRKDNSEAGDKLESKVDLENKDNPGTHSIAAFSSGDKILLQTAYLMVQPTYRTDRKGVHCKVVFDSGSQRSYITKKAAVTIGASMHHKEKMVIGGFGGTSTKERLHDVVEFVLSKRNFEESVRVQGIVVEKICSPLRGKYISRCSKLYPHLAGLTLADEDVPAEVQEVQILIGLDHYHDVINGEMIRGKEGPIAIGSRFGFILSGAMKGVPKEPEKTFVTQVLKVDVTNEELYSEVKKFWELEAIGVKEEEEMMFNVNVEKRSDRYYVNLPWKNNDHVLCDNFEMSRRRLMSNLSRMKKNPELRKSYCDIMKSQEEAGVIEEVKSNEVSEVGKTYYMPHHAVVKEEKLTTKTRVVYDASSKSGGSSLNECLYSGTTTFTNLLAVLIRFRCYRVAMIADIQQAFLTVGVKEEDRDALRFLWVDDAESAEPQIRHMRFARVCFGVISSMAHLDTTIRHHLDLFEAKYVDTVERIRNSMYVDDLTSGHSSCDEAWKFYKESKHIFARASMNIRKWKTSDEMLSQRIQRCENSNESRCDGDDKSYVSEMLNPEEEAPVKVLGIPWNDKEDILSFKMETLKHYQGRITKRVLLRAVASVFDPLGFLSPLTVTLKILFQDVCKNTRDWDVLLDPVHQLRWDKFIEEVRDFNGLHIQRCFVKNNFSSARLIGFGDASEDAYAACIYIVCQGPEENVSSLVVSKTRVAPLIKQTMPRLELLASLILSRLMKKTRDELKRVIEIEKVVCLTDAEIVLNWIQNKDKEYKQYVQNRVRKIRENIPIESWYHVPGVENVSDLPSRGCLPKKMEDTEVKDRWLYGPAWIRKGDDEWPIRSDVKHKFEDLELKKKDIEKVKNTACLVSPEVFKPTLEKIISDKNFSTLSRLIRVTGWCKRFIDNCRRKIEKKEGELDADEYSYAEGLWIRSIQNEMKTESGYKKRSQSLGVYEDEEGFLRCQGRIGKAKIEFGTRFPLLIPTYHHVTELIIREAHEDVYHNGVKETLADVRARYWIVKGRQNVKKIIRRCYLCKILEGLSYPSPVSCDLPDFRVIGGRAFQTAGVDFCGPVYIRQMYRKDDVMNKAYIAITTCATSRMIHLELTPDLTTSAYLRSQQRFTARRGFPGMMVSDNGKTFKGRELRRYNARHGIKWRFNLPRAPWWGGMFERMVRSTKRCLKKAVGQKKLTYEEFLTILVEVEAVINNRPLTYVDENDLDQILTPSHLFCGRRTLDLAEDSGSAPVEIDSKEGVKRMRLVNSIIQHFWKRWSKEYLVELRENDKMKTKQNKLKISEGDVVLIHEDNVKRNRWSLGKIEEVISGNDGEIRGAVLKTCRHGKAGQIRRPLQKLYPLEIQEDSKGDVSGKDVAAHVGDKDDVDSNDDNDDGQIHGHAPGQNSEFLGSPGVATGGRICQTHKDNIEKLLSQESNLKSKRTAAIDGQIRRRINDLKNT